MTKSWFKVQQVLNRSWEHAQNVTRETTFEYCLRVPKIVFFLNLDDYDGKIIVDRVFFFFLLASDFLLPMQNSSIH